MSRGETTRPVGRPRTTVDDLPGNWREIIMDCGQDGGSAVEMRCLLGIGQSAWETLLSDSEDFRLTVKAAQDLCQVWWERHGRKMAVGDADGNATVWIFNMKNRFGWSDKQEVDHTTKGDAIGNTPTRIEIVAPQFESDDDA